MFLKGFEDIRKSVMHQTLVMTGVANSIKAYNGTSYEMSWESAYARDALAVGYNDNSYRDPARTSSIFRPFLILGSGNTPVTLNDYCLNAQIPASTITALAAATTHIISGDTEQLHLVKTILNNSTTTPFTIAELGIIVWVVDKASTSYRLPVLAYREVLNNPYTVQPQEMVDIVLDLNLT